GTLRPRPGPPPSRPVDRGAALCRSHGPVGGLSAHALPGAALGAGAPRPRPPDAVPPRGRRGGSDPTDGARRSGRRVRRGRSGDDPLVTMPAPDRAVHEAADACPWTARAEQSGRPRPVGLLTGATAALGHAPDAGLH